MTTAQLTGKIKFGPYTDCWDTVNIPSRSSAGKIKNANARSLAEVATRYLEKEDTLSDKAIGYGICGFTLFYLVAQVARVIL